MSSFVADVQELAPLVLPGKSQSPANGKGDQLHSDGDSMEEVDFSWEEYLEENGAVAAPHTAFKHVEISLQSSFQPGMKLEVANKGNPDTYWVATIITTCGQLLLLRFCGYGDERKADFWCDVMTADLHPVGWCTQNNKVLMPPEDNVYLRKETATLHQASRRSCCFRPNSRPSDREGRAAFSRETAMSRGTSEGLGDRDRLSSFLKSLRQH